MTPIIPVVREMTLDEQVEYGLCARDLMLEQEGYLYRLTAGSTDTVQVFQAGGLVTYVLTRNQRLDYVALDWYQGSETDPVDSLFLQGEYAISECVGSDWRNITQLELAGRLANLFM